MRLWFFLVLLSSPSFGSFSSQEYISLQKDLDPFELVKTRKDLPDSHGSMAWDFDRGIFFVATPGAELVKVEAIPFRVLKRIPFSSRSNITFFKDKVLGLNTEGVLVLLDSQLKEIWRVFVGATHKSLGAFDEKRGLGFLSLEDETVIAFRLRNGEIVWRYRRKNSEVSSVRGNFAPLVQDGRVIVGTADGYVVSLRVEDGSVIQETNLVLSRLGSKYFDVDAPALEWNDNLVLQVFQQDLVGVNPQTLRPTLRLQGGGVRAITQDKDGFVVSGSDGGVRRFSLDQRLLWETPVDAPPGLTPIVHSGKVYIFRTFRFIDTFDLASGKLLHRKDLGRKGGFLVDPVVYSKNGQTRITILNQSGKLLSYRIQ